ncbi:MAG: hypothetical protein WAL22_08470 [Solirubrobacteraceae bacterium]
MPASEHLSRVAPYARRLLDDDYVQDELDRLFANLRDGSQRARRKGPAEAATDRQLRNQLAAALAAAGHVARAMNDPEPEPPKRHRVRRVLLVAAIAGAGAVGYRQLTAEGSVRRDG